MSAAAGAYPQGGVAAIGIAPALVQWQRVHGRHDLPWQGSADPYRVWLSEVMLQQTQVATVVPYFTAFVEAFPTVADLAAAPIDQVMSLWSGLGYYSRARHLHAAARSVMTRHGGIFPADPAMLAELPGVGPSTAAAIAVFGFGARAAILDGNVKRVFCRLFGIPGQPGETAVVRRLWSHAQAELPSQGAPATVLRAYTQGLMDLGATLCTRLRPDCPRCPLQGTCIAWREQAVTRYPAARPRAPVPIREVAMLLLFSGPSVLIERRAPTGIWGGLWSLPECASGQEPAAASVLSAAGVTLTTERVTPYARFEHAFTHFKMKASVWQADLDDVQAAAILRQTVETRWLALPDVASAPLPRPVKSLLLAIVHRATPSDPFPYSDRLLV